MTQPKLAKLLAVLDAIDDFLDVLEELIEETKPCTEYGHACHHCTECDPGEHV